MIFSILYGFFTFFSVSLDAKTLTFAVSADYPPFEYFSKGELTGFDIDLAQALSKELGAECCLQDMSFSNIVLSVDSGSVDAGISCCTATPERAKRYDFSDEYHRANYALVVKKNSSINSEKDLANKRIAVQIGTTMSLWLESHSPTTKRDMYDTNTMAIESLNAGNVEGVLVEDSQARQFCAKNKDLTWKSLGQAEQGFAVMLPKKSPLTERINQALKNLKNNGTLEKIRRKYLG